MTEEQTPLVLSPEIEANLAKLNEADGWEQPTSHNRIDRFWNPSPQDVGQEIKGVYLETREFTAKSDGSQFSVIVLVTAERETVGVTRSAVLESALQGINPGDGVSLIYEGKRKNQKGPGSHHVFQVKIKRMGTPAPVEDNPGQGLMAQDDPHTRDLWEQLKIIVKDEYGNPENPEEIVHRAEKCKDDGEMTEEELTKLKVMLANQVVNAK